MTDWVCMWGSCLSSSSSTVQSCHQPPLSIGEPISISKWTKPWRISFHQQTDENLIHQICLTCWFLLEAVRPLILNWFYCNNSLYQAPFCDGKSSQKREEKYYTLCKLPKSRENNQAAIQYWDKGYRCKNIITYKAQMVILHQERL